ncbi:hypothetical protein B566_EDAN011630 [Ephemera danica]|nr:hypothetical protein B566_EDAN011630 [Ephemera danica]
MFAEWSVQVAAESHSNLQQPLIMRMLPGRELTLNFHPQLVSVLREVHFFSKLGVKDIPQEALDVYARSETLRQFSANLNLAINWYNRIRRLSQPVEFRLIEPEIAELDKAISEAQRTLTWDSPGVWEFITKLRDGAEKLEARLRTTQSNVGRMRTVASAWAREPLFSRGKTKNPLPLPSPPFGSANTLQKSLSTESEHSATTRVSKRLNYLLEEMSPRKDSSPLFEIKLQLDGSVMTFSPSLDTERPDGFPELVHTLLRDAAAMAGLVPRVASRRNVPNYTSDVTNNQDICEMHTDIAARIAVATQELYSFLWLENRDVFLEEFLRTGCRMIPAEAMVRWEDEQLDTEAADEEQLEQNTLDEEEDEAARRRLPDGRDFQGWLRVDLRPLRQSLLNAAGQWGATLRRHLESNVVSSLTELAAFIQHAEEGLLAAVKDGDYEALVGVMSFLREIKERSEATDQMFAPLEETLALLASYDQEMPEEVHVLLEELPQQWRNLKLASEMVRQQVAPFRAVQQEQLKRRVAAFEHAQVRHFETFRKSLFFRYDCADAYNQLDISSASLDELEHELDVIRETASLFELDISSASLDELEHELDVIRETASLFEVTVPEMRPITQCRREMRLAKQLWDYIEVVRSSIDDWKTTPWQKIDVENMDIECKKFAKEIRMLDKEVRSCDAYLTLEATVRNMISSLRAVAELQSPAIRERHWEQLMRATKVRGARTPIPHHPPRGLRNSVS